ncbi:MAG TPA: sigma 54-interacting transcriptional regulator [Sandaracinaceae bacterium LLY-WYZ-13_1]|nr:sigma 54-interacting transcriptional regulator [Sandaracinaceae bacterium LLY-WYZ-13_1]
MGRDDTTLDPESLRADRVSAPATRPALVLLFSREEPHRAGEVLFPPRGKEAEPQVLGRGGARPDDPHPRGGWLRQRPGENEPTPPLSSAAISRVQLVLRPHADGVAVQSVGRRAMRVDGLETTRAVMREGSSLVLEDELVLALTRRPVALPPARAWPARLAVPFGRADAFGMVGESPACWALRDELAFAAERDLHVLLHGPTGSGKELAARTIHALSGLDDAMIARNAATIPSGLVDAELFGNVKDYPNPGMKERDGLVGAADGSTLFLDEIGELPEEQQAHLLRVLDRGEYQRLGEERSRTSRFRLLGATNRPLDRLKHDLLARLTLRIELPSLDDRPEDVPLIARHLLLEASAEDAKLADQFVEERDGERHVRVAPELVEALCRAGFEHGVRELSAVLWRCIQKSTGPWIALAPDVEAELARHAEPAVDASEVGPDAIRAALEAHDWVVSRAYKALGLKNRHVLNRLMKKHGITRE